MRIALFLFLINIFLTTTVFSDQKTDTIKNIYDGINYKIVKKLFDGELSTYINVNKKRSVYIIDLEKEEYIKKVTIKYTIAEPISTNDLLLEYSNDFISWKKIDTNIIRSTKDEIQLGCNNVAGKFLKLSISKGLVDVIKDIDVQANIELDVQLSNVKVESINRETAIISCQTNMPSRVQVIYEDENSFLYYSKLSSVALNVNVGTFHQVFLSGLLPGQKYRYQVIVSDLNKNQVKSDVLGFMTKK